MYGDNSDTIGVTVVVDTVFAIEMGTTPVEKLGIKGLVPHLTTLLYIIKTSLEFPDVILETRFNLTLRLLHITYFIWVQNTIEESSFNVKLFDFPTEGSFDMSKNMEGLHVCCEGCVFHGILAINCSVLSTNVLCLETDGIPMCITFKLKNGLSIHDMVS